jgi:hypothetical protein
MRGELGTPEEVTDGHGGAVALDQLAGFDHRFYANGTAKSQ